MTASDSPSPQSTAAADSSHSSRGRSSSASSNHARDRNYAPLIPSQLRQSYRPPTTPNTPQPMARDDYFHGDSLEPQRASSGSHRRRSFNDSSWDQDSCNGEHDECDHGSFSPRLNNDSDTQAYDGAPELRIRSASAHGGKQTQEQDNADNDTAHTLLGSAIADGVFGSKTGQSTTESLAKRFGISHTRTM